MSLHGECKVLLKALVNSSHINILIQRHTFGSLSNVERMVNDESPSSLSSLAVMQMDDDLPVHLNVYISMLKQW